MVNSQHHRQRTRLRKQTATPWTDKQPSRMPSQLLSAFSISASICGCHSTKRAKGRYIADGRSRKHRNNRKELPINKRKIRPRLSLQAVGATRWSLLPRSSTIRYTWGDSFGASTSIDDWQSLAFYQIELHNLKPLHRICSALTRAQPPESRGLGLRRKRQGGKSSFPSAWPSPLQRT